MSCYEPVDHIHTSGEVQETFLATQHTGSPWSNELQHGGPVAALLTRAMDRCMPRAVMRIARLTVEFLGAVPIGHVRVSAHIERPGRRVELLTSRLEHQSPHGQWRTVATAHGWRLASSDTCDVRHRGDAKTPFPADDASPLDAGHPLPQALHGSAFVQALNWRYTPADRTHGTPTVAWMQLREPLVAGETTTPLEQAVAVADVANGIGARLDPDTFSFPNTELTVHLHHPPQGTWFGLAAETSIGPDGIGMSAGTLHDESGPIGRVAQTVLIQRNNN